MDLKMDLNIPGYRIESELGRGGMAKVYLAIEEKFQRRVALKVMELKFADSPQFTERFLREGRFIATLSHPNIVKVFDSGIADGRYYLSMEYLSGGTLQQRLRRKPGPAEGLAIVKAVAQALGYAHQQGIVHRDVKSQNILFYPDGTPVLSDFGIAKARTSDATLTVAGAVIGSPLYMSPEQIQGKPVDARSDLYSLGVVFYEVLTGVTPYTADAHAGDERMAILFKHLQEPIPELPISLAAFQPVLNRLLAKDAAARFASAAEFLAALDEAERDHSVQRSAVKLQDGETIELDTRDIDKLSWDDDASKLWHRRRIYLVGLVTVFVALGAAGVIYWEQLQQAAPAGEQTQSPVIRDFSDSLQDGSQGPQMVVIPAGEFMMGSPEDEEGRNDDERRHRVRIDKPFALGKYPVSFAEYDRFAEATGRVMPEDRWGRNDQPVINVSWEDALAYAQWLSNESGEPYRLPTEAEWEYAARAGTATAYWWGQEIGRNHANCRGCGSEWDAKQTAPIGRFAANAFGLHGMLGNLWEWTCSEYQQDYAGAELNCSNADRTGALLVIRGGAWEDPPRNLRAAKRGGNRAAYRFDDTGFRVAKAPL